MNLISAKKIAVNRHQFLVFGKIPKLFIIKNTELRIKGHGKNFNLHNAYPQK